MANKLAQAFEIMQQQLKEEVDSVRQQKETLDNDRASLEAEKNAMAKVGVSSGEVLEINVGGEIFYTKRSTLLAATEDSLLNSMFSGRWEESMPRDSHGRIFLDVTPTLFSIILSHLRAICLSPPGTTLKPPEAPREYSEEFRALVEYFGLRETLYGKAHPAPSLMVRCSRGRVQIEPYQVGPLNATPYTRVASENHDCCIGVVGTTVLPCSCIWKVTVVAIRGSVALGVTAEEIPTEDSYSKKTSFMWASHEKVYIKGVHKCRFGSWKGWVEGDVAIFKLNAEQGCLKMHNVRLKQVFELTGLASGQAWRLHANLDAFGNCIELAHATSEEAALVA